MLRVLKILEMAWLLIGIFAVGMGAYEYKQLGWDGPAKWFFGSALVAGIFFAFRRRQRLKFQESEQAKENADK